MPNKKYIALIQAADVERAFSGSSGPGGQNVNRRATKTALYFDIGASRKLSEEEKRLLKERIPKRYFNKGGILRVSSQEARSQKENERRGLKKLNTIIATALAPRKKRATTIPKSIREKMRRERRATKEKRAERKRTRRDVVV